MNPKLQDVVAAFNARQDAQAMTLARALSSDADPAVRIEAQTILASCLFEAKDYRASSLLWESLARETDRPESWVSVVTSLLMGQEFEKADAIFPEALAALNAFTQKVTVAGGGWMPGMASTPDLVFNYAQSALQAGSPERALAKIMTLTKLYAELAITDDHFLLSRGIPALASFCALLKKAYPRTQTNSLWNDVFNTLLTHLDAEGKDTIDGLKKSLLRERQT